MPCRGEATNNKVVKTGREKKENGRCPAPYPVSLLPVPSAFSKTLISTYGLTRDGRLASSRVGVWEPLTEVAESPDPTCTLAAPTRPFAIKRAAVRFRHGCSCFTVPAVNAFHMATLSGCSYRASRNHRFWWEKTAIYVPEDEQTMSNHSPQPDSTGLSGPNCIHAPTCLYLTR